MISTCQSEGKDETDEEYDEMTHYSGNVIMSTFFFTILTYLNLSNASEPTAGETLLDKERKRTI